MNIIRKTIATASGVVLSLGFALPAAALNVDGTVNTATQGTVNVGGTGVDSSADANVGVEVGVGAQSSGTTSGSGGTAQSSGSADASATMEANAGVTVQPLIITRGDVDAGRVEATISSPSAVKTRAELSGYAAAEMKADSNIASIEAASDNVAVTYKQHAKLFGFIPVTIDATATVDASGNVEVSYPWYAFLMTTNKADLEARIQSQVSADINLDASANAEANADASATAEAVAELSAGTQAKVVAAVKAAMQAQLEAELNASATGNVSVQ